MVYLESGLITVGVFVGAFVAVGVFLAIVRRTDGKIPGVTYQSEVDPTETPAWARWLMAGIGVAAAALMGLAAVVE